MCAPSHRIRTSSTNSIRKLARNSLPPVGRDRAPFHVCSLRGPPIAFDMST